MYICIFPRYTVDHRRIVFYYTRRATVAQIADRTELSGIAMLTTAIL